MSWWMSNDEKGKVAVGECCVVSTGTTGTTKEDQHPQVPLSYKAAPPVAAISFRDLLDMGCCPSLSDINDTELNEKFITTPEQYQSPPLTPSTASPSSPTKSLELSPGSMSSDHSRLMGVLCFDSPNSSPSKRPKSPTFVEQASATLLQTATRRHQAQQHWKRTLRAVTVVQRWARRGLTAPSTTSEQHMNHQAGIQTGGAQAGPSLEVREEISQPLNDTTEDENDFSFTTPITATDKLTEVSIEEEHYTIEEETAPRSDGSMLLDEADDEENGVSTTTEPDELMRTTDEESIVESAMSPTTSNETADQEEGETVTNRATEVADSTPSQDNSKAAEAVSKPPLLNNDATNEAAAERGTEEVVEAESQFEEKEVDSSAVDAEACQEDPETSTLEETTEKEVETNVASKETVASEAKEDKTDSEHGVEYTTEEEPKPLSIAAAIGVEKPQHLAIVGGAMLALGQATDNFPSTELEQLGTTSVDDGTPDLSEIDSDEEAADPVSEQDAAVAGEASEISTQESSSALVAEDTGENAVNSSTTSSESLEAPITSELATESEAQSTEANGLEESKNESSTIEKSPAVDAGSTEKATGYVSNDASTGAANDNTTDDIITTAAETTEGAFVEPNETRVEIKDSADGMANDAPTVEAIEETDVGISGLDEATVSAMVDGEEKADSKGPNIESETAIDNENTATEVSGAVDSELLAAKKMTDSDNQETPQKITDENATNALTESPAASIQTEDDNEEKANKMPVTETVEDVSRSVDELAKDTPDLTEGEDASPRDDEANTEENKEQSPVSNPTQDATVAIDDTEAVTTGAANAISDTKIEAIATAESKSSSEDSDQPFEENLAAVNDARDTTSEKVTKPVEARLEDRNNTDPTISNAATSTPIPTEVKIAAAPTAPAANKAIHALPEADHTTDIASPIANKSIKRPQNAIDITSPTATKSVQFTPDAKDAIDITSPIVAASRKSAATESSEQKTHVDNILASPKSPFQSLVSKWEEVEANAPKHRASFSAPKAPQLFGQHATGPAYDAGEKYNQAQAQAKHAQAQLKVAEDQLEVERSTRDDEKAQLEKRARELEAQVNILRSTFVDTKKQLIQSEQKRLESEEARAELVEKIEEKDAQLAKQDSQLARQGAIITKQDTQIEDQEAKIAAAPVEAVTTSIAQSTHMSRTAATASQQQTLMEESGRMLEFLRKEVLRLRRENGALKVDLESVSASTQRLLEANKTAESSFTILSRKAKEQRRKSESQNSDFKIEIEELKMVQENMKDEIRMKQEAYIGEVRSRLQYQESMGKIVEMLQKRCRDSRLVEEVLNIADDAEHQEEPPPKTSPATPDSSLNDSMVGRFTSMFS